MITRVCPSFLLVFLFLLSGCVAIKTPRNTLENEVWHQSGLWNTAFVKKDMSMLLSLFSDDAQLATAGGKWKSKREGEEKFSRLLQQRPDLHWVNEPKEIVINNAWEVAYEYGDWSEWWTERDGPAKIDGRYFMMWKRKNGSPWLIHAAVFTPLSCTGTSQYCKPHPYQKRSR